MDPWACYSAPWADPRKKSLIATERDRWERARFAVEQQDIIAANLVVIDEFDNNLDMTRGYARVSRGERAIVALPCNTPTNTTTISSLTIDGIGPSMLIAGSVTRAGFEAYVSTSWDQPCVQVRL